MAGRAATADPRRSAGFQPAKGRFYGTRHLAPFCGLDARAPPGVCATLQQTLALSPLGERVDRHRRFLKPVSRRGRVRGSSAQATTEILRPDKSGLRMTVS